MRGKHCITKMQTCHKGCSINFKYFKILQTPNLCIAGNSSSTQVNFVELRWVSHKILLQKPQDKKKYILIVPLLFYSTHHSSRVLNIDLIFYQVKWKKHRFFLLFWETGDLPRSYRKSVAWEELISHLLNHMAVLPFPTYSSSLWSVFSHISCGKIGAKCNSYFLHSWVVPFSFSVLK